MRIQKFRYLGWGGGESEALCQPDGFCWTQVHVEQKYLAFFSPQISFQPLSGIYDEEW